MRHVAFLLLLLLLLAPSLGFAANKTVKVRGVIGLCGTDECGIGGLGAYYAFAPHSAIYNAILSACGFGDDCEIIGKVDAMGFVTSVSHVRHIDTNFEPGKDAVYDAAMRLISVDKSLRMAINHIDGVCLLRSVKVASSKQNVWRVKFYVKYYKNYSQRKTRTWNVYLMRNGDGWQLYKIQP